MCVLPFAGVGRALSLGGAGSDSAGAVVGIDIIALSPRTTTACSLIVFFSHECAERPISDFPHGSA